MKPTTCQICGRPIKANTGVIAHHGYKRPGDGWQTSSCAGARFAPYEVSADRIPAVIASLETYIEKQTAYLADFEANPPATLSIDFARGSYARPDYREIERPADFTLKAYDAIPRTYANEHSNRRREIRRGIEGARGQLEYLRARLAAWKPAAE